MLKILSFSDLLGNEQIVSQLLEQPLEDYDALVFLGDIPNPKMFKDLRMSRVLSGETRLSELMEGTKPPEGLKRALVEVEKIAAVFEQIRRRRKLFGVLGNADLLYYMQRVDLSKGLISLHLNPVAVGDYTMVGYSGRPAYLFETSNPDEQVFTEEQICDEMAPMLRTLDNNRTILATHVPPHGILDQVDLAHREYALKTYGDKAKEGRIGSLGLRRLVEEFHPALHFFGHIDEAKGVYFNGSTVFINSGCLGGTHEYVAFTKYTERSGEAEVIFTSLSGH